VKQVEFILASAQSADQIAAKCKIPTIVAEVNITLLHAASEKQQSIVPSTSADHQSNITQPAEAVSDSSTGSELSTHTVAENILRVDASRIDNVLNLVGELIIGKSMLQQALNEFAKRYPKDLLRGRFADAMAFQARVLNDLQRSVMKIRMVPVDQLFRRF